MARFRIPHRRLMLVASTVVVVGAAFLARPTIHILPTMWGDRDFRIPLPASRIDDASRMNETAVAEVWPVPDDANQARLQLAELLQRAHREGRKVSIGGARHSMGGHTIYPHGVVIDMRPFKQMQLDVEHHLLHVQSGALWSDVIHYLDPLGYSVEVMQSDNSFSVGGSISVNCHGWQLNRPPICSTVESLRLMTADGSVVVCSRLENANLFSLVLGGYGLFGVILDVDLHVVPNECYRLKQYHLPIDEALAAYQRVFVQQPPAQMAYARLNIVPQSLFGSAIVNVFTPVANVPIPKLSDPNTKRLTRAVFRGSAESDYGKELRWSAETKLQPYLAGKVFSRNQLLNDSVDILANRSADSTDILHEYFVPADEVSRFVRLAREIIRKRRPNLLNVTVRHVKNDTETYLRYADHDMIALVLLFQQQRTTVADAQMERLTQELIDASLASGGRYYLPYRLHATVSQFERAYPQAKSFFAMKRNFDPQELFQNEFYLKYGAQPNQN